MMQRPLRLTPERLYYHPVPRRLAAGFLCVLTVVAVLAGFLAACNGEEQPETYVARLGNQYLMQEEVDAALRTMPPYRDSLAAYEQYVSRWVTNQLLVQEARDRNLADDPDVIRRLKENEQSVLISKLLDQVYDLTPEASSSDVRTYFEQNRERLRLREPYLRVRYFGASDSLLAVDVRERMLDVSNESRSVQDSIWISLVQEHADEPDVCLALSTNYLPSIRLFSSRTGLRAAVMSLGPGDFTDILFDNGTFHIVQFVERIPEGTLPELAWVEPEIRQRLLIQSRKQMYADQVERLRNEALAREALEIRGQ